MAAPSPPPSLPRNETRQTRPTNFNPYQAGGLGIIPRQGVQDPRLLWTRQALTQFTYNSPMRLLALLPDLHPSVGLATWNALRLSCPPDGLKIVAVPLTATGNSDEEIDAEGTADIETLWLSQPNEIGGLHGLQTTLTLHSLFAGLPVVEAVPGKKLTGVRRVLPVDSLSMFFARTDVDADLTPYQKQSGIPAPTALLGYQKLNPETVFWRAIDNFADDAYGRAPYAAALSEILCDLALMQDLRDCLHNAAWPRLGMGFNFTEMYNLAQEQYKMDGVKAAEWVQEQFAAAVTAAASLKSDDNVVHDSSSPLTILEGGKGLGNIAELLAFLRQRILQSLKTLPTLMGVNDGSTQTYTTAEWQIYAAGLETLRAIVIELLVKVASLHLRLLGKPLKAVARYEKIRTTDAQVDANTEATKTKTKAAQRDQGWISQDEASMAITGHDAVAPEPITKEIVEDDGKLNQLPGEGTTTEQQDANKQKQQNEKGKGK